MKGAEQRHRVLKVCNYFCGKYCEKYKGFSAFAASPRSSSYPPTTVTSTPHHRSPLEISSEAEAEAALESLPLSSSSLSDSGGERCTVEHEEHDNDQWQQ